MYTTGVLFIAVCLSGAVAVMPGMAAQDVRPPLYKMRTLIGHAIENQQGKDLGDIEEVIVDAATGDVAYAVVAVGEFLGVGGKLWAIPWHALQQPLAGDAFRLAMTEEQLKNAPSFDKDRWPDLEDRHWSDTIHAYYGQPPYWGKHLPPKTAHDDTVKPVAHRLLRAGQVLQREVMNARGQRLGDIEELVIDAAAGNVAYAVLSVGEFLGLGGKLLAIPWPALQQSAGLGTFRLDIDKEALQKAPGFDKDHWPNMADPRWGAEVHSYYGQQPYWERRRQVETPRQANPGAPATGQRQ
jgi:sporulation protein YlmC with PRC-barrel domain